MNNGQVEDPVTPAPDASATGSGPVDRVKQMLPDLSNLYLQPLDPSSDLTLADRFSLAWQSVRPWGEFFDLSAFNLPTFGEVKTRVSQNVETYFYNYFLLACVHVIFFAFGHFRIVVNLLLFLGAMYFLHFYLDEDIDVAGKFVIDRRGKMAITAILTVFALVAGHVITLIISTAVFLLIIVGIHSIIRDNTITDMEPMM